MILKNEVEQIVYGEVYVPLLVDTDMEAMTADEVAKACWNFNSKNISENIDQQHNLIKNGCVVVESFIARKGDPDFAVGAWVMGVKCTDEAWQKVLKGEFNGFSFYGRSERTTRKVSIEVDTHKQGYTSNSLYPDIPTHNHKFEVFTDLSGNIIFGETSKSLEHTHKITAGTATNLELNHTHRYRYNEY